MLEFIYKEGETMKIIIIQNTVKKVLKASIENVKQLIKQKSFENLDFIVLPEMFTTPYQIDLFHEYQQDNHSEVIKFLSELAIEYHAYVIGGSVVEVSRGKLYNTSYIFNRQGKVIKKYRKIKLFSVIYPDGTSFDEGEVLEAGQDLGIFETEFGMMGIMICFDIRFPTLALSLMKKQAKVIFVPGAFNQFTGPLHWQTTFRARAIDNQLFMVGASPSNESYGTYKTYGHSLIVDPWGKIIKELDGNSGFIEVEIDLNLIDEVREKLPIVKNIK